jgi:hypothetical protein
LATVRYVNVNNANPTPPYTNWVTAATNIQDAVDAAGAGDEIVVTNGTYAPVTVNTPLTLQSLNGPEVTAINGGGTAQCVYLATNAVLVGFTLTNGAVYGMGPDVGGGVYCESTNAVLTNCVLSGNSASGGGGVYGGTLNNCALTGNSAYGFWRGFYQYNPGAGGGAYSCTLNNCTLTSNNSTDEGGGAYSCTLNNCTLTSNNSTDEGGGADNCTLNNCALTGNSAWEGGGAYGGTLNDCTLTGNSASGGGGAVDSTLNNCALMANTANGYYNDFGRYVGGVGGGAYSDSYGHCTLNNCTLTGNSAYAGEGGGAYSCTLDNCIAYFNSAPVDSNYDSSSTLNYCCTTPMPTSGLGNISADPQLASASHLSAQSPCIGAGSATYASGTDIDGEAWANPPSIGCDEYHGGAVTGPLTVSLTATYTNVATGFPVGLTAFIAGRTDLSVWDFGDGDVAVNEPYTTHTWTAPGNYLVALWAFNDSYPEGVSATLTIHVEEGLHYVAASGGNPVPPYTSWATAATNIQDAVDMAGAGGTVFVTNGTYVAGGRTTPSLGDGVTNRVTVDKPLTVCSVNGSGVTVIQGQLPGATNGNIRCAYLTNGATLMGFTLTNGVADYPGGGGGVYCESSSAVLSNCVLTGNWAGPDSAGGGASGGTLNNCNLTGNSAYAGVGGGAVDSTLNNCTLTGNSAHYSHGGGAWDCTLNNCTLTGNSAPYGEGGGACRGTLNNCTLTGNSAEGGGGASSCTLNNCTLIGNVANVGGGACGGDYGPCILNNCTLTSNSASDGGGGAYGGTLNNCIVCFNTPDNYVDDYWGNGARNYCCTTPMPTSGVGNITSDPKFVNYAGGNLRLQTNSPCINAGDNAYVVGSTDLDGNPRIVGGAVDIGAYEYQTPTSIISYA